VQYRSRWLHRESAAANVGGVTRVRVCAGAWLAAITLLSVTGQPARAASAGTAALQAALKSNGLYPIAVDGVRGPYTTRGVRLLQRRRGLIVDGVAGPQTRRAGGLASARA
jgi:hypothetical protein